MKYKKIILLLLCKKNNLKVIEDSHSTDSF